MARRQEDPGDNSCLARFLGWFRRLARRDLGLVCGWRAGEPTAPSPLPGRRILILALDKWTYGPLVRELEQSGFEARLVRESVAALDILSRDDPAVLIVVGPADLGLYRVLRRASSVPILALAPKADEEQTLDAFAAGVDQFQAGPISLGEVVARVCALLRRGT